MAAFTRSSGETSWRERENVTMRLCWGFLVYVNFLPKHPVYGIFRLKINGVQEIEGGRGWGLIGYAILTGYRGGKSLSFTTGINGIERLFIECRKSQNETNHSSQSQRTQTIQ